MEASEGDVGDDVHAESLLSMPDGVHHKIVSELATQSEWGCVRGLAAWALVCKTMQRVADSYVTVLREPQEVHLDAYVAMKGWPPCTQGSAVVHASGSPAPGCASPANISQDLE